MAMPPEPFFPSGVNKGFIGSTSLLHDRAGYTWTATAEAQIVSDSDKTTLVSPAFTSYYGEKFKSFMFAFNLISSKVEPEKSLKYRYFAGVTFGFANYTYNTIDNTGKNNEKQMPTLFVDVNGGVAPGLFHENFSICFPLRLGAGSSILSGNQEGGYVYASAAIQMGVYFARRAGIILEGNLPLKFGMIGSEFYRVFSQYVRIGVFLNFPY